MNTSFTKTTGGPLMAVDGLGRPLPTHRDGVPTPRQNRLVGLFYFLWLGEHGRGGPYDISKMVAEDPALGYKPDSEKWGGIGVYHHWGEPFYGYYCSDDEWVARRHIKLLMQTGIDFLFFDTTNAVIYEKNAKMIMQILQEYHDDGWKIPQVMFYTNTRSGETVERLLEAIYLPAFCRDTWFCPNGRPLIIAVPEECSPRARDFFDIKLSQWPNETDKRGGWPWMDFTRPQRVFEGLGDDPATINVSVAQHPQLRFGDSVLYGETGNCGRAYHDGANDPAPDAYLYGRNFAEQFERAIEADPPVVLVTGWNEWIAGRWEGIPERPVMFVDCANYEYSRDIEMMRGGYFDHYLMQLAGYVRRYQGMEPPPRHRAGAVAVYDGFADGGMPRHAEGYGGVIYENRTARNVITRICVSHDAEMLRFTLETSQPITPYDGKGAWMRLYLNTRGGQGYDYLLNLRPDGERHALVARMIGEGDELTVQTIEGIRADLSQEDKRMCLSVSRRALGLDGRPFTLWFKAADSREEYRNIEDFYDSGVVLPLGRLNFTYIGE